MKAGEFFENHNNTVLISAEMTFLLVEATSFPKLSEKTITYHNHPKGKTIPLIITSLLINVIFLILLLWIPQLRGL